MSDLYRLLEVGRDATSDDIRKAYLKLSRVHHPDKGGDPEKFKEIQQAYEVLSDSSKKEFYDMTGRVPGAGGEEGGGGGPGPGPGGGFVFPFDIGNLFGMFGPGGRPGGGRRGGKAPSKVEPLRLTLQQLYDGYNFRVVVDRTKFCETCRGSGAARSDPCQPCRGTGKTVQMVQMGGMIMQSHGPCMDCMGEGKKTAETCGACAGQKKVQEKRTLDVRIGAGAAVGERFVFQEACSETEGFDKAADLELVIQEPEGGYGRWKRRGEKGQHLETEVEINLCEALVGCTVMLDGHPGFEEGLYVEVPPGAFTGDVFCLSSQGMPLKGEVNKYGDVYVRVKVVVKANERAQLANAETQTNLKGVFGAGCRPGPADGSEADVQKGLYLTVLRD
jgi:DnaJ family protein A protein 2